MKKMIGTFLTNGQVIFLHDGHTVEALPLIEVIILKLCNLKVVFADKVYREIFAIKTVLKLNSI